MLAGVIKFVLSNIDIQITVSCKFVTAEPYFYASGNPCACAFALESEAIRENAQFHKDPKCARIVVESYIDDFLRAGRCSEVELLRKLTRALFKLEVSDLIQIKVDGLFSYRCTGTEHDSRVLGKLSRYLITSPELKLRHIDWHLQK